MTFSLTEIEATAKKAARGAGYDWGLAEEAAKATGWLCAQGIDGAQALAQLLVKVDGAELAQRRPMSLRGDWRAGSGDMCPLLSGAALSDCACLWGAGKQRIIDVMSPVLLLPFAAFAARALGENVCVVWGATSAVTDGAIVSLVAENSVDIFCTVASVEIKAGGEITAPLCSQTRAKVAPDDAATLARFAQRTYAPATEESRRKGAGAEQSDIE